MPGRLQPNRSFLPRLRQDHALALLAVLLIAVFVFGGGSRHDIASLAVLRPLALAAAAVGVLGLDRAALRAYRTPFVLLGALALLIALQLVPLPPSWWSQLPERAAIARLDAVAGLPELWRPLTLSPMKTANALASLSVPFAVLVLFCQLDARRQGQVLALIVALAAASAVLGILQVLSGPDSPLYFYAVTHRGGAVGLFANRNHHAAFLAAAMLVSLHLAAERGRPAQDVTSIAFLAAAALLFAGVLGNISRGGLLCGAVALAFAPTILLGGGTTPRRRPLLTVALFALPALGLALLFALTGRSPALARLLADGQADDLRAQVLPTLFEMARAFQPWGAGFGAFEYAYRMREPVALMLPRYLNNAHNDPLQFVIEGGAPGALLLAGALAAIAWRVLGIARQRPFRGETWPARGWLGFGVLLVLCFASLFDYALRVPSVMAVAIIALALLDGSILTQKQRAS